MKVSDLAKDMFNQFYADLLFRTLKGVPKGILNQFFDSYKNVFISGFMEGFNHCAEMEGTNWGYENDFHR